MKDDQAEDRAALMREIEAEVADTRSYLGKDALDPRVLEALARVPREAFVPVEERRSAYLNQPLPIGYGQTISQPYIVAVMTDLLELAAGHRVLEVGTGCGYQCAVLAELAGEVYSIEVVPELAASAAERLRALGYCNVHVRQGDGAKGWPEAAPFERIIVTAAAGRAVPPALVEQLAPGGRMVIPVERPSGILARWAGPCQDLLVVIKDDSGRVEETAVLPVAFVPLVSGDR
jgi:protein-L-isoaspartate(D-aspartate) O-methyltransferase